jgi:hypothetical protein
MTSVAPPLTALMKLAACAPHWVPQVLSPLPL